MTDEKKKLLAMAPAEAPAEITVEHAVVPVPFGILQAITNYLTTKPYTEVHQFIQAISQIKAVDKRKLEG